ncbi:hypothetical protein ACC684_38785, partial [Rhizobium ruizarguesonis]
FDAYGALDFLSKQSFFDIRRVALMGFSAGGTATLEGTKIEVNEQLMDRKFRGIKIVVGPLVDIEFDGQAIVTQNGKPLPASVGRAPIV